MILKLVKEMLRGKSIGRILTNLKIKERDIVLSGKVLDLGGRNLHWIDGQPRGESYMRFMRFENVEILRLNIDETTGPDHLIDFEKEKLPFQDNSVDSVLLFNLLEHIYNFNFLTKQVFRVLKDRGILVGSVPFLKKIHPDPHDFFRYSNQALRRVFEEAGFSKIKIETIGFGPFVNQYSQIEFIFPKLIRIILFFFSFSVDWIVLRLKPILKGRFPLSYLFIIQKS
ncbi:MAG: methyltransferase domain-containing protein [Candidatus Nealsonbacteria bacterium]|nr:methyltransferase domain-containing protein [Candidatus Nealsonbacteria bacterium]